MRVSFLSVAVLALAAAIAMHAIVPATAADGAVPHCEKVGRNADKLQAGMLAQHTRGARDFILVDNQAAGLVVCGW